MPVPNTQTMPVPNTQTMPVDVPLWGVKLIKRLSQLGAGVHQVTLINTNGHRYIIVHPPCKMEFLGSEPSKLLDP